MKPSKDDVRRSELAKKWLLGNISTEEKEEFSNWYNANQDEPFIVPQAFAESEDEHQQRIFSKIKLATRENKSFKFYWSAAAVLFILGAGLLFHFNNSSDNAVIGVAKTAIDIKPGGNNAVLTLANGKKIALNDVANGEIAEQSGIQITKTADGQLVYRVSEDKSILPSSENPGFNTIETPKGGQYQIDLPDGTKVWLNAASSLKYPTLFSETERRVELTGEGYFEVAKLIKNGRRVPFLVKSALQTVDVLGTHFNIDTYGDENITKTTLLEGSVRISQNIGTKIGNSPSRLLKPGQQAKVGANQFDINDVDIEEAIAWKNGYFYFQNEELKTAMNKVARWYDIEVFYQGDLNKIKIGGYVSRSKRLSEVMRVLQLTGKIKFKTNGRRVTLMP